MITASTLEPAVHFYEIDNYQGDSRYCAHISLVAHKGYRCMKSHRRRVRISRLLDSYQTDHRQDDCEIVERRC